MGQQRDPGHPRHPWHPQHHRNTTRELLEDLERFTDVYQSRIGDLGAFVRSQGDAHFDVLASDERPDVTGTIRAQDFDAVHKLLERFYRVILIDTGNNMRAENWLAAAGAADLLVVTSTVRGHRLQRVVDARRAPGRGLPEPEVQGDHGAVGSLGPRSTANSPTISWTSTNSAPAGSTASPRPGARRRLPSCPTPSCPTTRMQWLRACAGMAMPL